MRNTFYKWIVFFCALAIVVFCIFDGDKGLGNYKITLSPNNIYVVYTPEEDYEVAVIEGNITQWGKHNHFLYGYQESYCYSDGFCTEQGYFFVDVQTGVSKTGLSLQSLGSTVLNDKNDKLKFTTLSSGKKARN